MRRTFFFLLINLLSINPSFSAPGKFLPEIQLANIYHQDIDIKNYLVSEKLDGVRGYWNGKDLISKEGKIFLVPKWFPADFPSEHLEGELWIDRGKFEMVSGIVRTENPDNQDWQKIHFMLFDMPKYPGTFVQRLNAMKNLVANSHSKYLRIIPQSRIYDHQSLIKLLNETVKNGGEGLMLHREDSLYSATRNDDLLKLKTYEDAEAKVLAIIKGKGKYQKMMGAILVENEEGIKFKIGGGFSDEQRSNPPAIGSIITYKYFGKTKDGKPRFASFMRVREEYDFVMKEKSESKSEVR
jgi:DNA ligase-1